MVGSSMLTMSHASKQSGLKPTKWSQHPFGPAIALSLQQQESRKRAFSICSRSCFRRALDSCHQPHPSGCWTIKSRRMIQYAPNKSNDGWNSNIIKSKVEKNRKELQSVGTVWRLQVSRSDPNMWFLPVDASRSCRICRAEFWTSNSLQRSMQLHTDVRKQNRRLSMPFQWGPRPW